MSVRCDWNPDLLEYEFPLRAGASWPERSSCHPSSTSTFSVDGTARVSGPEHLSVGGGSVVTWIVTFDGTLRVQGDTQSFSETIHDEDHFSPDHGITVKEVTNTTDTDPSGKQTKDSETRYLENLSPGTSA